MEMEKRLGINGWFKRLVWKNGWSVYCFAQKNTKYSTGTHLRFEPLTLFKDLLLERNLSIHILSIC